MQLRKNMLPLLFLLIPVCIFGSEDRFLFPHGFFDSSKIKPWDAMYMNMMAQSNLEYGGTTLEELKPLEDDRKVRPRPTELARTREEDDPVLDVTPKEAPAKPEVAKAPMDPFGFAASSTGSPLVANDGEAKGPKPKPSRQHDAPMEGGNPFEEIVTRKPPRSNHEFGRLRNRLRGGRKRSHKHRHHKHEDDLSIEEDSVVKPKHCRPLTTESPIEATPPPTLIPKIRRLPNNPYGVLDISKPTVLRLPFPPDEEFSK